MQDYPIYKVYGWGPSEREVAVEYRVETGAGGGLEGMADAEAVARALMDALVAAGATSVSATRQDLTPTVIPRTQQEV